MGVIYKAEDTKLKRIVALKFLPAISLMYCILTDDPEPLSALRTGVPMVLDGIIAKALAKDRETRYQHVDELPAYLRAIASTSLSRSRFSSTKIPADVVTKLRVQPNVRLLWVASLDFLPIISSKKSRPQVASLSQFAMHRMRGAEPGAKMI